MPQHTPLPVKQLKIDLENYRTVTTTAEIDAVHALIALRPHYFWDLMRSLIESGYDGTENIIVLKSGPKAESLVKEGNRRVGALKIIHGILPLSKFDAPADVEAAIKALPAKWRTDNESVPCSVYEDKDADIVKRLVARTHARGETAGRLNWEAVARARHNRDELKGSEPGLDLLEEYLKSAKKLTAEERERWGGDYPLTVLDEALPKVATRLKLATAREVVEQALKDTALQKKLGQMIHDIGTETLKTRELRLSTWGPSYDFPTAPAPSVAAPAAAGGAALGTATPLATAPGYAPATATAPTATPARAVRTLSLSDPKSVSRELRRFVPKGKSSSKVVDLLFEAKKLKIGETPICFTYLLRSMFDVSVTAYCSKHSLPTFVVTKKGKKDKSLAQLLTDASKHLMAATSDRQTISDLKTASAEINGSQSLLSIPVMNGLVHSPSSIITEAHVIAGFHKIFPLLVQLNK